MTLTTPRPHAPASRPAPAGAADVATSGSAAAPPSSSGSGLQLLIAEFSLFLVTLVTVAACSRLFNENDYLATTVAAAGAVHAVAAVARRLGWRRIVGVGLGLLTAIAVVTFLEFRDTSLGPIPTGATWRAVVDALSTSWSTYRAQLAPVPSQVGFTVVLALTFAIVAVITDSLAFGSRLSTEAVLPTVIVFAFTSIIGAPDRPRVAFAAAFVAAVLAFWVAHRAWDQTRQGTWFGSRNSRATRSTLLTGAVLALTATAVATAVAAVAPEPKPLVDWREDRPDRGSRTTESPLAAIRQRLGDSPAVVAFDVATTEPHYWRLTALEEFDGTQWATSDSYRDAKGSLPKAPEPEGGVRHSVQQTFDIDVLESIWLPSAYRPRQIDGDDVQASFSDDSGSLLTDLDSANGLRYTVESDVLDMDGAALQLAAADAETRSSLDKYLKLPAAPAAVSTLAADIAARFSNPFDRARALQDFFQSGDFTYDLGVDSGHSLERMEQFLTTERRGFCEQFAATYAVVARAMGLPARVAVGFTPGDANGSGYTVSNRHAHAWPEVYLNGVGWVAFEPTPGRGIPGGDSYTGLPAEQAAPNDPNTSSPTPPATVPTTSLIDAGSATSTSLIEADIVPDPEKPAQQISPAAIGGLVILAVVATLLLLALAIALLARRRKRRATSPTQRALLAWGLAGEQLHRLGIRRAPHETPAELARRARHSASLNDVAIDDLARIRAEAAFSPGEIPEADAALAEATSDQVNLTVRSSRSLRQRLLFLVDPRRLRQLPD